MTSDLILQDSEVMLSQTACWTKDVQQSTELVYLENQITIRLMVKAAGTDCENSAQEGERNAN